MPQGKHHSSCTGVLSPTGVCFHCTLGAVSSSRTRVGRRLPREYVPSPVGVGDPDFKRPVARHRQGGITSCP